MTCPFLFLCVARTVFMSAPAPTRHDVFLSRASDDKPWARTLCDALIALKLDVYLDERRLELACNWTKTTP
jgi:hypothetical protein